MNIINGKAIAAEIQEDLIKRVERLKEQGITPGLCVIQVGDNPASSIYVRNKGRKCKKLGIRSYTEHLPDTTTQDELFALIDKYNADPEVNGILVQLPLPKHINSDEVFLHIAPEKDVDGFHVQNLGLLLTGGKGFIPSTPKGVIQMLDHEGISIEGKNVVIVGRSNIVGKPLAALFLSRNATVTVCHSKTVDLPEICSRADILVCAIGRLGMIGSEYIKPGAVVIDVGINRDNEGKLHGDVDYNAVCEKTSYITPVPGGVGPMTIIMLMENTVESCENVNK